MNIPNILTLIRFLIIPIFAYYLFEGEYIISASLFLLAGITDILDGYIARKFGLVTSWGKLADPLADKSIQITALVLLTYQHLIPFIILVIFAIKELAMIMGGVFLYTKRQFVVSASWYGKLSVVIFYIAIIAVMITKAQKCPEIYVMLLIIIALISALYAFFRYILQFKSIKKNKVAPKLK